MKQSIKFTIAQDGTVSEEVIGAIGNECENRTRSIEENLGEVTHVKHKSEYYLAQPIDNFWINQDIKVQNNEPDPAWRTAMRKQVEELKNRNHLEN